MPAADALRRLVIAAGLGWAVAFIVIGLRWQLQLYGDGAIFSYAVAVQDAWAFHWHNISGRLSVYAYTLAPAEAFVALTGSPAGGIAVYGLLWFAAPLLSLAATYAADDSKGRIIFATACFSTAVACPLVFGFPTEMWLAHALFWPALAVGHYAHRSIGDTALVLFAFLVLIFAHEGGLVLAALIVAGLSLRGLRNPTFLRAAVCLLVALAVWAMVKWQLPPDDYFASAYARAATHFFDVGVLSGSLLFVLLGMLIGYGVAVLILTRLTPKAHLYAAGLVAAALAIYWLAFDRSLHATDRYYFRTILLAVTVVLGMLASLFALKGDGVPVPLSQWIAKAADRIPAQAVAGAFVLLMLIHAVETAKFVTAWTQYKAAVQALATGTASDPALGNPRFVSSDRIGAGLNRLSWFSTTPYLSAVLTGFAPQRLVVDPKSNYFWLSCATATANVDARRAVPRDVRALIGDYHCLHRN